MTNLDHLNDIIMQITTNPHKGEEPSLYIRGIDTLEQVDTYSIKEVEEIIHRLSLLLTKMKHTQEVIGLPTMWDDVHY